MLLIAIRSIHSTIHVKFCRQREIMYIRFRYISRTIVGNAWAWQGQKCMHVRVLMDNFIITASKQIIMLCSKFTQLEMLVKIAHCS